MEIKKISSNETYLSRIVCYELEIDGQEIEIIKKWFFDNNCVDETEWEGTEDSDKEFIEELEDEEKDKLDDFISNLE